MKSSTANKKKSKSYSNKNSSMSSKIHLLPIIFIISVLPFIMHFHSYNPKLNQFPWFGNISNILDVFLYYKQVFFVVAASIMLLCILYKLYKNSWKLETPLPLILIALYGVLALLSTVFSKYSTFGYSGIYEQFESVFVLLGYAIVVIFAFYFISKEDDLQTINKYFLISVLVFSVLGLSQATGHDFFRTTFGKKLYVPSTSWSTLNEVTFNFADKTAYLTLYNPNYAGVYASFVIAILVGLFITEKRVKYRIPYGIAIIGMVITLYASGSAAGTISLVISLLVAMIIFRKVLFRHKPIAIVLSLCLVFVILGAFTYKYQTIKTALSAKLAMNKTTHALSDIETNDNLEFTYNGNKLYITFKYDGTNSNIALIDSNSQVVSLNPQDSSNQITINDERFKGIVIVPSTYNNIICLDFKIENKDWVFTNQLGDNTFYYLNYNGQFDKIKTAESALFTGYEKLASGRGYIWSRTIPLLKDNIILGSGADTFALVFPHTDYLNYYYSGFDGEILTKPHNLYLQIGVQTGVISLIAFLAFYILYFITSLRLYLKCNYDTYWEKTGASYLIGTLSYMIAGLANDSTITVAPIFWCIIGVGVAINYRLKKNLLIVEKSSKVSSSNIIS